MVSAAFPNRPFNLRERVWLIQQDIAGNQSRFGWELWIDKTGTSPTFSSGKANRTLLLNGVTVGTTNTNSFDFRAAGPWLILSGTSWVPHAGDGTLTLNIGAGADYDILGATGLTASMSVNTIPRASKATYTGGSTITAGTAVTINTNRASGSFTHKIEWLFGDLRATIGTSIGASVSWTPPLSMLTQIPSSTSGNGGVLVTTYSGSTVVGVTDTPFTLVAPASVVPTIDPLTGTDTNPTVASVVGAYVQNLSRLKVGVTAAGAYGSTITATEVTVDGVKGSPSSSYALPTAGTRTISAKVTDSRGRTATRSGTVPVLAYTPPAASSANVRRATSAGVVNENQSYLRVDLNATVKSLVNSTERNGMTIKIRTRPTNGAWTNRNTITGALTYNNNFIVSGGAVFPPTTSFDVEISVTDKVGQSWTRVIALATSAATLDMVGTSVGIGKMWEQGALDVGGDIYQNGNVVIDASRTATTSTSGIVELATNAETQTGTDSSRAVTPAALASRTATESRTGIAELATQAEVDAATDTSRVVTPHKVRRASYAAYSIAAGLVSHASVPAQGGVSATVTLPSGRFSQAPIVQLTSQEAQTVTLATSAKSATAITIRVSNWLPSVASGTGTIAWTAIQMAEGNASG